MLFLTYIDLNKNELCNAKIQNLDTEPLDPSEGLLYYDTSLGYLRYYNGVEWVSCGKPYILPIAGTETLGGIMVGDGLAITNSGLLSANVLSVAGKTGSVILDKNDVGLGNVDNTSDLDKPISIAQQAALSSLIQTVTGLIDVNSTSTTLYFTGIMLTAFALMNGEKVLLDISVENDSVIFSTDSPPTDPITCVVVSS